MKPLSEQQGFTIIEILVALSIFVIAVLLVGSMYIFGQRSYAKGSDEAELAQNARVTLDRMSRELRQAADIVTVLPATDTDPLNPPANEIFFQDGHDSNAITYYRYYLSGNDLMRQHKEYYFSSEPTVYVAWNSVDQAGNPPIESIIEDNVVGEYFDNIQFWGSGGEINIDASLSKGQKKLQLETSIFKRN